MTPAGLAAIKGLTGLKRLHLIVVYMDLGTATLADILPANLETLEIGYIGLKQADIAAIGRLRKLKTLRFWSAGLTDESIRPLAELPNLETLEIFSSKLSDSSIETFRRIPALRRLQLRNTELAEASVAAAFKDGRVSVSLSR